MGDTVNTFGSLGITSTADLALGLEEGSLGAVDLALLQEALIAGGLEDEPLFNAISAHNDLFLHDPKAQAKFRQLIAELFRQTHRKDYFWKAARHLGNLHLFVPRGKIFPKVRPSPSHPFLGKSIAVSPAIGLQIVPRGSIPKERVYRLSDSGEKDGASKGEEGKKIVNGQDKPKSDLSLDASLQRLDAFLSVGTADRVELTTRRILGLVRGIGLGRDVDQLLKQHLRDLDFDLLKNNLAKMQGLLVRFFQENDVNIIRVSPYFDRTVGMEKRNVLVIVARVRGREKVCFLKWSEEGPRREYLGLRINNILTDSPIPFMASGHTILQAQVRGTAWDLHPGFSHAGDWRSFHFHLGKANEFGRLLQLGDRKAEDLLVLGTRVSHVDFGASFSRHESVRRFANTNYMEDFEKGGREAQRIIISNYGRYRNFLKALLDSLSDETIAQMNAENERGLFLIERNPKSIIEEYLRELDEE